MKTSQTQGTFDHFCSISQLCIFGVLIALQGIVWNVVGLYTTYGKVLFWVLDKIILLFGVAVLSMIGMTIFRCLRTRQWSKMLCLIPYTGAWISVMQYRAFFRVYYATDIAAFRWFFLMPYVLCVLIGAGILLIVRAVRRNRLV